MHRILLVEDEETLLEIIKLNLDLEGYEVIPASNGKKALQLTQNQHFDLLLLDVMLPEIDGFQICEQVRLMDESTPIMFLTAKDSPSDRIQGLKRGADDYLTKPFHLEELLLRVKKLLSRSGKSTTKSEDVEELEIAGSKINFKTFEVKSINGEFLLTKKEAMLLKLLTDRENEVVSRNQILQTVWGYDVYPSTRTIDNFILAFRKYFEPNPKNPVLFHSIRGIGYKFTKA
jgi:two-component system, OmpR family, alkaline phosphatase synthesis response regulator PhoP